MSNEELTIFPPRLIHDRPHIRALKTEADRMAAIFLTAVQAQAEFENDPTLKDDSAEAQAVVDYVWECKADFKEAVLALAKAKYPDDALYADPND